MLLAAPHMLAVECDEFGESPNILGVMDASSCDDVIPPGRCQISVYNLIKV